MPDSLPLAVAADAFPVLAQTVHGHPLAYLDNAATTQVPRPVLAAMRRFEEFERANIHRGVHTLSQRATDAFEQARTTLKRFVGADARHELVFSSGTTEALNLVASGLSTRGPGRAVIEPGDEIIVSGLEHHANLVPWQAAARRSGATLRILRPDARGHLHKHELKALLNARTRVFAVTACANATGERPPYEALLALAADAGALTVLDAAQVAAHAVPDLSTLACDFMAFSGHKMYGPMGIGALVGRRAVLERLVPVRLGGDMVDWVSYTDAGLAALPSRLPPGSHSPRPPPTGRSGERRGEAAALWAAMGVASPRWLRGGDQHGRRTEAVAKHFLGSHHTEGGIHGAHANIPPRLLVELYGKPFQAAITMAGLRGIMPCYNSVSGEPASSSTALLTTLLREEMGFNGLLVSDYGAISNLHTVQRVAPSNAHAGLAALQAGLDMELPQPAGFAAELRQWFSDGRADVALLDRAVHRVLAAKFRMGLFEHPFALTAAEREGHFHGSDDRAVTLEAARESIVLLRNDGVLPVEPQRRTLVVIGCHAVTARFFFGGYTHYSMAEGMLAANTSMAGLTTTSSAQQTFASSVPGTSIESSDEPIYERLLEQQQPGIHSLVDELRLRMPDTDVRWAHGYPVAGADESGHQEALDLAATADLVLLTLGGKHGTSSIASMGEGIDATDINLPRCQEELIVKLAELGIPMIGVHLDGRPISSDAADTHLSALIEAWSPAETGAQAIVDVLTGAHNPSGRLPVSVAHNACLLYTSDAADERSSVDLGGRGIITKKKHTHTHTQNNNNDKRHKLH